METVAWKKMTMTRRLLASAVAVFAFAAALPPRTAGEVPADVRAKASPVFTALSKIKSEPDPASAPGSRRLTFSEAEFNAYVACRLADEGEAYVKAAEFKLLAKDRVEGRVAIDLGKAQTSGVLPQKQDLLFTAGFETREGKIRITMDKLFLGTQPISPAFVDIVIGVVSRLQGIEPTTLGDWYDLPTGVLRLETQPGKVVIIY
jgi:hypothetical protein